MAWGKLPWSPGRRNDVDPTRWNAPFAIIAIALFCIVFARANATYWIGRGIVAGTRKTRMAYLLNRPSYQRAERLISSWGAPAVSISFLTIGFQTMVNLAAGVIRMPHRRYLPAVTIGCVMWALIYATVGFVGFEAFSMLWSRSPGLAIGLLVVAVAALVSFIVVHARNRCGQEIEQERPETHQCSDR